MTKLLVRACFSFTYLGLGTAKASLNNDDLARSFSPPKLTGGYTRSWKPIPVKDLGLMPNSRSIDQKLQNVLGESSYRHLATTEELKLLNQFLEQIEFLLPPMTMPIEKKVFFFEIKANVDIYELKCKNISLQNVDIEGVLMDEKNYEMHLNGSGINLECSARWHYELSSSSGTGDFSADIMINSLSTTILLTSENFETELPHAAVTDSCNAEVTVTNPNIDGSGLGAIIALFEDQMASMLSEEIEGVICDEMKSFHESIISSLNDMSDMLNDMFNEDSSKNKDNEEIEPSSIVIPDNLRLFDLESDVVAMIVGKINEHLDENNSISSHPHLIMQQFLGDHISGIKVDGSKVVENKVIYKTQDDLLKTVITLQEMRLEGLDNFQLDPLNVTKSYYVSTSIKFESIRMEIDVEIEISPTKPSNSTNLNKIQEPVTISMEFANIDAFLELVLMLDMDLLESKQLGSFVHTYNILPCVKNSSHAFSLSNVTVDVGKITTPVISYVKSGGMTEIISNVMGIFFVLGESVFDASLPNFVKRETPKRLKEMLDEKLDKQCEIPSQDKYNNVVDFRHLFGIFEKTENVAESSRNFDHYGQLFKLAKEHLDMFISSVNFKSGLSPINDAIIGPLTRMQSKKTGELTFENDLVSIDTRIKDFGIDRLQIEVLETHVQNIDSFGGQIKVLDPKMSDPFFLHNTFGAGMHDKPLRISTRVLVAIDNSDISLWNDMELSINIKKAEVLANILVLISEDRLFSIPLRDISNIHCWISMMPDVDDTKEMHIDAKLARFRLLFDDFDFGFEDISIDSTCHSCTSPYFQRISDYMNTQESKEMIFAAFEKLSAFLGTLLDSDQFHAWKMVMIENAKRSCPHDPLYSRPLLKNWTEGEIISSSSFLESNRSIYISFLSLGGVAVAIIIVITILRKNHLRLNRGEKNKNIDVLQKDQLDDSTLIEQKFWISKSMIRSSAIPLSFRIIVPFIILGNIGLFISGHLNLGAKVQVQMQIAGENLGTSDNLFEFSMANSITQMIDAGAIQLAIIIAIFSGAWPYLKQLLTLMLLFLPSNVVSHQRRGSILIWLDVLGKWSMLDIFILVMSLISFRMSLQSPSFLPPNLYSVDIIVIPVWGLYANLIAQLLSQISSHFIIYYHRKDAEQSKIKKNLSDPLYCSIDDDTDAEQSKIKKNLSDPLQCSIDDDTSDVEVQLYSDETSNQTELEHKVSLSQFVFVHDYGKMQLHSYVRLSFSLIGFLTFSLFIIGFFLPSFNVQIFGLVGVISEAGEAGSSLARYNIFNVTRALADLVNDMGNVWLKLGLVLLIIVFLGTCIVVPLALIILVMVVWLVPMKICLHTKIFSTIEIITSWQYVEVYILGVVTTSLFIPEISSFMLQSYCDELGGLLSTLLSLGLISSDDARCLTLHATIEANAYLLIFACLFLLLLSKVLVWYSFIVQNHRTNTSSIHSGKNEKYNWYSFLFVSTFSDDSACLKCEED